MTRYSCSRSTSDLFPWPSTDLAFSEAHDCCHRKRSSHRAHLRASGHRTPKKPRKRKSRAVPKPPIKELLADERNFKDLVHEFTGQKVSSAAPAATCSSSLLVRPSQGLDAWLAFNIMQSLRAVRTISVFFDQRAGSPGAHVRQEEIEEVVRGTAGLRCNYRPGPAAQRMLDSAAVPETYNVTTCELDSSDDGRISMHGRMGVLAGKQIASHPRLLLPH